MNAHILHCCSAPSSFLIEYGLGSKFYVCSSCLLLKHWSRGIKKKTIIAELENGFERPLSSTMDVSNND